MKLAMMWHDSDKKRSLETKIKAAAEYYTTKYGGHANLVYVHPSQLPPIAPAIDGIELRADTSILPDHIWLGVKDGSD